MLLTLRSQLAHGTAFSPASLNPAAWFKLGTGITESGGAVSQWADQSGNARHLTQGTGSAQPALQGDGTILFDGSSDFMKVTGGFALAQPTTVAMVVKQVSWTSGDTIFDGNGGDSMRCTQNTASPRIAIYAGTAFDPFVTDLAVGAYGVLVAIFNGASSSLQIDANAADTGNAGASSGGGLTLGCNGNGINQHSNIRVAEVCVFASAISGDDLTNLRAYLAAIRDAL